MASRRTRQPCRRQRRWNRMQRHGDARVRRQFVDTQVKRRH